MATGETLGFVSELLFEARRQRCTFYAGIYEKNRPAYELCVICTPEAVEDYGTDHF